MGLSTDKKEHVQQIIADAVRKKLDENQYLRTDVKYAHFCYPLLGKDVISMYFFVHSLGTSFLTSIYEDAAVVLANGRFKHIATRVKPYNQISTVAQHQINTIMDDLASVTISVDRPREVERLRTVCQTGKFNPVNPAKVDIWLEGFDGSLSLINMEIINPNKRNFKKFKKRKRRFLTWTGVELARNPDTKIETFVGIPYNPYYPEPYHYWVMSGMLDIDHEVKVAEDLWDFIGGEGTYEDLLDCFEQAGIELRSELDAYFKRFT